MHANFHAFPLIAALGLVASAGVGSAQEVGKVQELERAIANMRAQNQSLRESLVEARRGEKESADALALVRTRLAALGKNLLDGGNERLVQAMADIQVIQEQTAGVEASARGLQAAVREYLRNAVTSDPDARLRVETSLRELDVALGLTQKPLPDIRTGSLQRAKVVSIDSESGLLVLNVGEKEGARIGMTFRLLRGEKALGEIVLVDVRKDVCGAFIENIQDQSQNARLGDEASVKVQ
jgi:hypothetical protein